MNQGFIFSAGWILLAAGICLADTISEAGTLNSPEDSVLIDLTLVGSGTVTLQTYGFGEAPTQRAQRSRPAALIRLWDSFPGQDRRRFS